MTIDKGRIVVAFFGLRDLRLVMIPASCILGLFRVSCWRWRESIIDIAACWRWALGPTCLLPRAPAGYVSIPDIFRLLYNPDKGWNARPGPFVLMPVSLLEKHR